LRPKYLKLCHTVHQGADSCLRRARQSVFWPGMTADVKTVVEKCEVCAKAAPRQQQQPLQQPETPSKAWSRVSADIMTVDGKQYLVTVDNLSGYLEIDLLRAQTSWEVILKLRMIFARFGPPEVLITDNGPQFTSAQFAAFAQSWRFQHRTSSPHYPRSNGQAEAAVKVAKAIMTKAKHSGTDVYMALLDYRNTPHSSTNLSPAEVMLNGKTRTATLPQYQPQTTIDQKAATAKSKHQRVVKASHDKHVRELQPLQIGEKVWFTEFAGNKEKWSRGHIKEVHPSNRSYIIEVPSGGTYRRNRVFIRIDRTSTAHPPSPSSDDENEEYLVVDDNKTDIVRQTPETVPATPPRRLQGGYGFVPPATTRSGRVVKPVEP